MLLLLSLQTLMLIGALLVLATPFVRSKQSLLSKNFAVLAVLMLLLSGWIYSVTRDSAGLKAWFSGGQEHYQLMETFNDLGGMQGAIVSLQKHLMEQPNDGKAWFILGKLYLGKQDVARAHEAFVQAHKLEPDDAEITKYYELNLFPSL